MSDNCKWIRSPQGRVVRVNTRGCREPMDAKTVEAIGAVIDAAVARYGKPAKGGDANMDPKGPQRMTDGDTCR